MRKSGFTLVELLAVMAAMFAIMGVSVVMLIQVFNLQYKNSKYSDEVRTLNRLVVDFRNDVHAYGKPEIPNEGNVLLRWKTESVSLEYVMEPGMFPDQKVIVRTLHEEGKKFSESYRFPDQTIIWCTSGEESDAGLVALSLWTISLGTEMPPPETLNPFDRTLSETKIEPRYAGNWRTIVARHSE